MRKEKKRNKNDIRALRVAMASKEYSANFDSRVDDLLSGRNLSNWGVDTTPLHLTAASSPAGGSSDRSAAVGDTPLQPSGPPLEPVVPHGSHIRSIIARDFLEDPSLINDSNLDVIKGLGGSAIKLLHLANGWAWQATKANSTPSIPNLAKQLVQYTASGGPDADSYAGSQSISDEARSHAALTLQVEPLKGGPYEFSLNHASGFVKTLIASAPQPVGGTKRSGPVERNRTPAAKKPKGDPAGKSSDSSAKDS